MTTTPEFGLQFLYANQNQKEVYVNQNMAIIDAFLQSAVISNVVGTPPATPSDGDKYIVPSGALGVWSTHVGSIAVYIGVNGAWSYFAPENGWLSYCRADGIVYLYNGSAWVAVMGAQTPGAVAITGGTIDGVTRVGIGVAPAAAALHIEGDGTSTWSDAGIYLANSGTGGREYGISTRADGRFSISDETAHTERVALTSAGDVCIGGTDSSFGTRLDVVDTTFPQIMTTNSSGWAGIGFNGDYNKVAVIHYGDNATGAGELRIGRYDNSLVWEANPIILDMDAADGVFRLSGTGYLCVGGLAPTSRLHAYGDGTSDHNNSAVRFQNTGTNGRTYTIASRENGWFSVTDINASGTIRLNIDASGNTWIGQTAPHTDNASTCGVNGNRWSAVWAATGTIQTSDEREKTDISPSTLGLEFVKKLRPISYKWKVGGRKKIVHDDGSESYVDEPGRRIHWGLSAQEVKKVVDDLGVDFGGHIITDINDANSSQGLRYDQFIAPLIKAIQELSDRVDALEKAKSS